ncbi:hypothetical protein [Polyangium fumosum]|uniref:Keratin associated protein n=1 Tax=Polyangium fumosum TaxID=889272 RepID=A0A4U1IIU4_9BACT|nr:hypothetical protein [Polyangium fumosum]TKC93647.1 hypothetical protein E8A74_49240 [Polyangium fumosum]
MSVNRWKLFSMPVVVLGIASPLLSNCGGKIPGVGGVEVPEALTEGVEAAKGCDEFKTGDFGSLALKGDAKVQGKIKSFLQVSYDVNKTVVDLEKGLISSCGALGKDLGMKEDELRAEAGGGKGADKVCTAVAAKVKSMLAANAEAKISIEFDPPKCYADVDGMAKCLDACGSPIEPGKLEASCSGGEVSGSCDAQCKGTCSVEAGAQCTGTCKASCSGKCEAGFKGSCGGKCDGKCDGKDAKGAACAGQCEGKCDAKAEGTCSGTCSGSCSAACEVKAAAKCEGSCSGGCSVAYKEPKCSGEFKPPSVDVECQQSCTNRAAATAKCDPPAVRVVANGKVNTDVQKLVSALSRNLPGIIKLSAGSGAKIKVGAEGLVKTGKGMVDVVGDAGGKALACIKAGVDATANATTSIDLNVKASVSVTASASAKTN